jgi:hypothetical protein
MDDVLVDEHIVATYEYAMHLTITDLAALDGYIIRGTSILNVKKHNAIEVNIGAVNDYILKDYVLAGRTVEIYNGTINGIATRTDDGTKSGVTGIASNGYGVLGIIAGKLIPVDIRFTIRS